MSLEKYKQVIRGDFSKDRPAFSEDFLAHTHISMLREGGKDMPKLYVKCKKCGAKFASGIDMDKERLQTSAIDIHNYHTCPKGHTHQYNKELLFPIIAQSLGFGFWGLKFNISFTYLPHTTHHNGIIREGREVRETCKTQTKINIQKKVAT